MPEHPTRYRIGVWIRECPGSGLECSVMNVMDYSDMILGEMPHFGDKRLLFHKVEPFCANKTTCSSSLIFPETLSFAHNFWPTLGMKVIHGIFWVKMIDARQLMSF